MSIDAILDYLTYKLDCAKEQEEVRLKVDLPHCYSMQQELTLKIDEKYQILQSSMPVVVKYKKKNKPKVLYKKDGSLSSHGIKWMSDLFDAGKDASFEGPLTIFDKEEPANPNSVPQLKSWLSSLGWQPTLYDYKKDEKTGKIRAIPKITDKDGNICLNIQSMFDAYPFLEELESFSMLKHRLTVFNSFVEAADSEGFMKAEIDGLTNTLRFKHKKPIANLPGVNKPYGKQIRGAIIIPFSEYKFCGSDMSSLEDTTKQHYMYYYDPEYVMQMRVPGFDPHIDIGLLAKMLTEIQAERFRYLDAQKELSPEEKIEFSGLKKIRGKAKIVNFSGIYGAGPAKIALTTGMTIEEATLLHKIYWERNKAVKLIAKDITIRVIFKSGEVTTCTGKQLLSLGREGSEIYMSTVKEMWLFNPVSQMWYSLRYFKDIFSTLNQGTGVYCFDTWIRYVRLSGIKIGLQYHDEIGFPLIAEQTDEVRSKLTWAIDQVNKQLKLNVPLGISIDFGINYAECH